MEAYGGDPTETVLFNSVEKPAIEQFPKLDPLTKFDGSEVEFEHGGDTYVLSSLKSTLPENIFGNDRFFFGLWKRENAGLVPTGFVEFHDDKDRQGKRKSTTCHISSSMSSVALESSLESAPINDNTQKFYDFEKGFKIDYGIGMKVEPSGQGLGTILFTASLAAMQNAGFETLEIYRDETKSKSLKLTPTDSGLLEPTFFESFYAKYATQTVREQIIAEGAGPEHTITRMPTTLSSMHLSILSHKFG